MIGAGTVGGWQEGAGAYQEVLRRGGSEAEAAKAATIYGLASGALNALSAERILRKLPGSVRGKILRFLTTGAWEAGTEALEEPLQVRVLGGSAGEALEALRTAGVNVAIPAFVTGLIAPGAAGRRAAPGPGRAPRRLDTVLEGAVKPLPSLLVAERILSETEAAMGLKSQAQIAHERARALGRPTPQEGRAAEREQLLEAIPPEPEVSAAAEAGLARRGIAPLAAPPSILDISQETDPRKRDDLARQYLGAVSAQGPLRTATEIATDAEARPEPTVRERRQTADIQFTEARRRADIEALYRNVPATFGEFALREGRPGIGVSDPGYMALRRQWDEVRQPLYRVEGPRLGRWEVVNRVTGLTEGTFEHRARAQLEANRQDAARFAPEPRTPLRPFTEREQPSRAEPTPPGAPSAPGAVAPIEPRPSPIEPLPGPIEPRPMIVPPPREPRRPGAVPVAEGFNPRDPDQLSRFVLSRRVGGIAPSPSGDLSGEYAALPPRYKNQRGWTAERIAEAISEQTGQPITDAEVLDLLSRRGRLLAQKTARTSQEGKQSFEAIEADELAALPEDVKVRQIAALTGRTEAEALAMLRSEPSVFEPESEAVLQDREAFNRAARDYFTAQAEAPADPAILADPHFERFGDPETITRDLFGGDRQAVAEELAAAKQDVESGRYLAEERARYETTPEGEQALVPGTPARRVPETALRPEVPQRPVEETPLFRREPEAEQPRLPGVEEGRAAYRPAPATFLGYQERPGKPPLALYNLTDAVGRHPVDSTVSAETLREAGFEPPDSPTFDDWRQARGVEEPRVPFGASAPRAAPAPIFFSGLRRLVEDKMPAAAPAAQVRNIIKQAKPEEVQWTGLDDWLVERGGQKVTKPDVLDFLAQNEVRVEEVTLGETTGPLRWDELGGVWMGYHRDTNQVGGYSIEELRNGRFLARSRHSGLQESFETFDEAARWVETSRANAGERVRQTKFGRYTLPGGENYRELLLTWSPREGPRRPTFDEWWDKTKVGKRPAPGTRAYRVAFSDYEREAGPLAETPSLYRSPHFEEPNVLAHVRFNDRTDVDGKRVLFV